MSVSTIPRTPIPKFTAREMTTEELEQQDLLEGYESQKRKRIGL
jgi:hypothetical protein